MNISLRWRLTGWYSIILGLTLAALGTSAYFTVQADLRQNLEQSLLRVAGALDDVIRKKQTETMRPLKPAPARRKKRTRKQQEIVRDSFAFFRNNPLRQADSTGNDSSIVADNIQAEEQDEVWAAVYEHILLNSKNFLIQIADPKGRIVWRSDNLQPDSLPRAQDYPLTDEEHDVARSSIHHVFKGQTLQMVLMRTRRAQISVGYTVEEIEATLRELFLSLALAFPAVLAVSTVGGWLLARFSLRPVDDIIVSAEEITAHNLSMRLPMPHTSDEIARLTATLNSMIERLEQSFIQVRQFTADASHELRTPLAILMGEIEVALRRPQSQEYYREVLNSALEEVVRLSTVVRNLLELSRAETGQVKIAAGPVNVSRILQEIAEDMEVLAADNNITLAASIEPDIWITGDEVRLHQAFLNVLDNAVKYNTTGGIVRITLESSGKECCITFEDTGIGIAPEALPHIFDRFFRADKSRSQDIQGNGLGLSIVKWIVEQHDGTVNVKSQEGRGTAFTLKFARLNNAV